MAKSEQAESQSKSAQNKKINNLILVIFLFALPLLYYFFIHVPQKESEIDARNLRLIRDFSKHISEKLNAFDNLIHTAAKDAIIPGGLGSKNEESIKNTLELIDGLNFISAKFSHDTSSIKKKYLNRELHKLEKDHGSKVERQLRKKGDSYSLFLKYTGIFNTPDINHVDIDVYMDIDNIISPIVSRGLFDDVLLAETNGKIIYQRDSKLFRETQFDSVINIDTEHSINHNGIRRGLMSLSNFAEQDFIVYSQPLSLSLSDSSDEVDDNLILHGFVLESSYSQESRSISYNIIILFGIIIILLGLSLPIIKLWQIGARGRYRVVDVIFLAISLLLFMGILSFSLIDYQFYTNLIDRLDSQLEDFSDSLQHNLFDEVTQASQQLSALNNILLKKEASGLYNKEKLRFRNLIAEDPQIKDVLTHNVNFQMVFWINSDGQQVGKWTKKKTLTPPLNVKSREYFQNVIAGSTWKKDGPQDTLKTIKPIWFEPVTSMATGENFAILSQPLPKASDSKEIVVSGMDFWPKVLFDPLLPQGFGFVIINRKGDVRFHDDKRRNLQENFITECNNNNKLQAAVYGNIADNLNLDYEGHEIRSYIRPLSGTPWYIVTYRDKEYLRTANLEILAVVFVIYLILVLFHVSLLIIIYYIKKSQDPRRMLPQWITPQASNLFLYAKFSLIYLCLFSTLVLYAYFFPHIEVHVFIFLLAPLFITLASFFAISASGNSLKEQIFESVKRHPFYLFVMLIIIVISFYLSVPVGKYWWMFGSVHLFILLAAIITLFLAGYVASENDIEPVVSSSIIRNLVLRLSYRGWFIMAAVFYLSIISITPTFSLFHTIGNYEAELLIKNVQYSLAKDFSNLAEKQKAPNSSIVSYFWDTTIKDSTKSSIKDTTKFKDNVAPSFGDDGLISRIFSLCYQMARVSFNKSTSMTSSLVSNSSHDKTWHMAETISGRSVFEFLRDENKYVRINTQLPKIEDFIHIEGLLVFPFIIALYLLLFVRIFNHISIFEFNRLRLLKLPQSLNEIFDSTELHDQRILLLSPPLAGKSAEFRELTDTRVLNMVDASKKENALDTFLQGDMTKVIIIDQLEFALLRPEHRVPTLNFMEQLIKDAQNKVILVSTIDPTYHLEKLVPPKDDENNSDQLDQLIIMRWSGVIAKFEKLYLNDRPDSNLTNELANAFKSLINYSEKEESAENSLKKKLTNVFRHEVSPSKHLQMVGLEIIGHAEFRNFSEESLISEITNRAFPYYKVLWSTCSKEEKLVLIQLCEDGIITIKKVGIVRRLLRRGVVFIQSYPMPINESFRRFVLSVYHEEDLVAETQGNSWNSTRIPLFLAIFVLVLFISITQKSVISDSLALISSMAALIPTLIRLSMIFFSSKEKKKEQ